ncbi:MAG: hypothetical protein GY803_08360 [Chloroflexi bacterium]|nr:hypothetical protein [Chloroflexota bacterium]
MSNFNWQTDDDVVWDDEATAGGTAVPPRRPWLTILFILAAIVGAGTFIYRQVNERVETAAANVESDILASHQLLQQAAAQNDVELFRTLLSGRSAAWSSMQAVLMEEGQLLGRDALGLDWLPTATENADLPDIELNISPELDTAELHFVQEYAVEVGHEVTETALLRHTAVYRRGSERWLYSPPDDEFWGEYTTNQGAMLTLAYPSRDAAIAEKLAFDLDAKLNEMCRRLSALNCPDDLRVHLRLDNESGSLQMPDLETILESGLRLELPAPTLVGLPLDEAGYQALYRGYAVKLATAVIPQLVGYECCTHAPFFHALLEYQLSQLGLRPWPVTTDDYARVVSEGVSEYELDQIWGRYSLDYLSSLNGWKVYAVVDYLTQRFPKTAVADMQRLMPRDRLHMTIWLWHLHGEEGTVSIPKDFFPSFGREWRAYALQQTLAAQEPSPIPWPEQYIYLSCLDSDAASPDSFVANIQRLNPDSMTWTDILTKTTSNFVNPLPEKDGLVLQSFGFEEDEIPTTTIWRPEGEMLTMKHDQISVGQFAPDGRLMAYGLEGNAPILIDVADCPEGSCRLFPLSGIPVWSPDGSDFILLPEEALPQNQFEVNGRYYFFDQEQPFPEWPLYRSGTAPVTSRTEEMIALGYGYAPFWLNETTYGYTRQVMLSSNSSDRELVIASTADDQPRVLLTKDELMDAVSERPSRFDLNIGIVTRHATQPNLLFILAFYYSEGAYLFSYDVAEETLDFHFQVEMNYFHSLGMSPDGRFLTLAGTNADVEIGAANQILLFDTANETVDRFSVGNSTFFAPANIYDWSTDGDWLAVILDDLSLLLVAPAHDYQRIVPYDLGGCTNVLWLNK